MTEKWHSRSVEELIEAYRRGDIDLTPEVQKALAKAEGAAGFNAWAESKLKGVDASYRGVGGLNEEAWDKIMEEAGAGDI